MRQISERSFVLPPGQGTSDLVRASTAASPAEPPARDEEVEVPAGAALVGGGGRHPLAAVPDRGAGPAGGLRRGQHRGRHRRRVGHGDHRDPVGLGHLTHRQPDGEHPAAAVGAETVPVEVVAQGELPSKVPWDRPRATSSSPGSSFQTRWALTASTSSSTGTSIDAGSTPGRSTPATRRRAAPDGLGRRRARRQRGLEPLSHPRQ